MGRPKGSKNREPRKLYGVENGQRFGRWTVLDVNTRHNSRILCECDCGNRSWVRAANLKNGMSKSCGACGARVLPYIPAETAASLAPGPADPTFASFPSGVQSPTALPPTRGTPAPEAAWNLVITIPMEGRSARAVLREVCGFMDARYDDYDFGFTIGGAE